MKTDGLLGSVVGLISTYDSNNDVTVGKHTTQDPQIGLFSCLLATVEQESSHQWVKAELLTRFHRLDTYK